MNVADAMIVVGVDGSIASEDAVGWAATMAADRHLTLHIVHSLWAPDMHVFDGQSGAAKFMEAMSRHGEQILEDAVKRAHSIDPRLVVTTSMPYQQTVQVLLDLSRHARLLVVGHTGLGGFAGMLIGSTAEAVAHHSRCPVAVVRGIPVRETSGTAPSGRAPSGRAPSARNTFAAQGPVVVGIDGSAPSEAATGVAFEEASLRGVPLVAVHAWTDHSHGPAPATEYTARWESVQVNENRLLTTELAGWRDKYPDVTVEQVIVQDHPRDALIEWSERAQLLILGSRGRGRIQRMLLGSTSAALVEYARCPVLLVPPVRTTDG